MGKYARALKQQQEDRCIADMLGITLEELEARRHEVRQLIDTPRIREPRVMVVSPQLKKYLEACGTGGE